MKVDLREFKVSDLKLHGIYRGVIEDNNDPLQNGRCKVRVFGVHSSSATETSTDGIAASNLPWAEPVLGLIEGSISGYGLFSVPLQGSHVFVFFENGNHMKPRYFGSAPGVITALPTGTAFVDPAGNYPDKTGSDFPSEAQAKYPNNIVLKTHGGHIIEIDSTEGSKRLKAYHSSGTNTEIDNDGNVTITNVGDHTETIAGDMTVTITGDCTILVKGDCNVTVTGTGRVRGNPLYFN